MRSRLMAAATLVAALLGMGLETAAAAERPDVLRIGYQKSSTLFAIIKSRGTLEQKLQPLGVKVTWSEFTSGLPLLEALNVGSLDFSADVADTVPIFAQAAGANITYVAQESPSPEAQAVLVRSDSPIKSVRDLKSKTVAVTRAAGSHYLLLATLAKAGLSINDITPAYLTAADARVAFEAGNVDAWVTWDPFYAAAVAQAKARVISDGRDLASYQRYYLTSTRYAAARPDVLQIVFDELKAAGAWAKKEPAAAAELLAPVWKLDAKIVEVANGRRSYEVRPVKPESLAEQQKIADVFLAEKLLPARVDASKVPIWTPEAKSN